MFIILVTYKKPLEVVDQYLIAHRDFLQEGYQKDYFIASGPQTPRTGGVIISQLKDRWQLESLMEQDPFKLNDIADYHIIEFDPLLYHANFKSFIE